MRFHDLAVVPVPGDGIVAHLSGAVVVVIPTAEQRDAALRLVEIVRETCAEAGGLPGRALARRFAATVTTAEEEEELPAFGSVADDAERGVMLFLRGSIDAHVSGGEDLKLSGEDAALWVDRVIGRDVERVVLVPAGASPDPVVDPSFELGDGVIPAGGVVLTMSVARPAVEAAEPPLPPPPPAEAEAAAAEAAGAEDEEDTAAGPPPAPPPVAPFESVNLLEPEEVDEREPLPLAVAEEPAVEGEAEVALVEGIVCSRGHFNSPDALYCSSCGISMVHQTHNLVQGPRPPLGFLVFDDGSTFTLDADYLMGRDPEVDGDDAGVRPLVLDDPNRSVSRIHAELRLVGWDVQVTDRGSANGTFLWNETSGEWEPLAAGAPVAIRPGARVALGRRTFVYETPHKPHRR